MRRVAALLGLGVTAAFWPACSSKDEPPPPATTTPVLKVTSFDVAEAGWGDAPVSVHFTWAIESNTGKPLTCKIDFDGDGAFDQEIANCKPATASELPAALPTHTYAKVGEHVPRFVVTDGERTAEATQEIYANKVDYAKTAVFPEKLPGFVKAEATPNTKVVLTFASEAQVPTLNPGDTLLGTSGNGYLIKVTTATKAGATLTVDGVQGLLNEAIENGFFGARDIVMPLDPTCDASTGDCTEFEVEKLSPGLPVDTSFPMTKSLGKSAAPLEVKGSGSFGVKVKLPPRRDERFEHSLFVGFNIKKFLLDVSFFRLNTFKLEALPTFAYDFAFKRSLFKWKAPLGSIRLGSIAVGPAVFVPTLTPVFEFDVSLKAKATVGFSLPFRVNYVRGEGLTGGLSPDLFAGLADFLSPNSLSPLSLSAQVKGGLQLAVLTYGVIGPFFTPTFTGTVELQLKSASSGDLLKCPSTPLQACASIKAAAGGEYGLTCPFFKEVEDESKKSFTIAEVKHELPCLGKPGENGDCPRLPDGGPVEDATTSDSAPDTSVSDTGVGDAAPMDTAGEEICDGMDNDGDGAIDEGCPSGFNWVDFWGKSPVWGYTGPVGGSSFGGLCAFPSAMVGICGRVDSKGLIALGRKCAGLSMTTDTTVKPYKYSATAPTLGACSTTAMSGSSIGGTIFDYDCPPNMVIHRVLGAAGSSMPTDRVGQIQVECVQYGFARSAGNVWKVIKEGTAMSPVYGTGPGTPFDWAPPDHTSGTPAFLNAISGSYTIGTDARIYVLNATGRSFTLRTK